MSSRYEEYIQKLREKEILSPDEKELLACFNALEQSKSIFTDRLKAMARKSSTMPSNEDMENILEYNNLKKGTN